MSGCVSNDINQNLDTEVTAFGNTVKFAWDPEHPFAHEYTRGQIKLIAEYLEVKNGQQSKPVKQILSIANSRSTTLENAKIFFLPSILKSIPESHHVCLYFEMNRQAIPIRQFNGNDTARFNYSAWGNLAGAKTQSKFVGTNLQQAQNNVNKIDQMIANTKFEHQQKLRDYNQQLNQENLSQQSTIDRREKCSTLSITAEKIEKPYDVVSHNNIQNTSEKICGHRAIVSTKFNRGMFLLPLAFKNNIDLTPVIKIMKNARNEQYIKFNHILNEYRGAIGPNSNYLPELGSKNQKIPVSSYLKDIKIDDLKALQAKGTLTEKQIQHLISVIGVELSAFDVCVSEANQQLLTKLDAWNKKLKSAPVRNKAKKAFILDKCEALFDETESLLTSLAKKRIDALATLQSMEALSVRAKTSHLPTEAINLNQSHCQLY